ncbi:MAG: SDR family NAD(P)-dependent oxidoreductase, partial [Acinetobacter sp.]
MGWLKDEVALITGGGSGLGLALVERFIDEGAHVGVLQRSASKVAALKARYGAKVVVVEGDVAQYQDNLKAVHETVQHFGKLDCFIGNAGIWDHYADIVNMSGEQLDKAFDEIMGINTKAFILGAKAALDELTTTEGSIIFTLSNAALYSAGGG